MKNSYYKKWTSYKKPEISIFIEELNVEEMSMLIKDILNGDSKIIRIFQPPKNDSFQEHIFPLIKDSLGKNKDTFLQALNKTIINANLNSDYDTINEIFAILRYFEIKIENSILNSFIINDRLPKDIRKNAAITFASLGDLDSYKYWKQYDYKKDNFIFASSLIFIANFNPIVALEHLIDNYSKGVYNYELITPLRKIFSELFKESKYNDDLIRFLPLIDDSLKDLLFNEIFKFPEFALFPKESIFNISYNNSWAFFSAQKEQNILFWSIELQQIIYGQRTDIISKYNSLNDYLNNLLSFSIKKQDSISNLTNALFSIIENIFTNNKDELMKVNNNFIFQLIKSYKPNNANLKLTETINFLITNRDTLLMRNYDFLLKETTETLSVIFPSKESTQKLIDALCKN
ncbi:MAG: hypothetical protein JXA68_05795 [Ignavibacteriales bacterium]|nr:hypothetical protein [Ignavibacteriales bacterium]